MKNKLKKIFKKLLFYKTIVSVKLSFKKRHSAIENNGEYKKIELTPEEVKEYKDYWSVISKNVNLKTAEICKSFSGKFDKRIIPEEFFPLYLEPKLNSLSNISFLENKSIYNKWFGKGIFPNCYFHKINGNYYDSQLNKIDDIIAYIEALDINFPIVYKPNVDSYGGKDVYFLNSKNEIIDKNKEFINVVVQEKLVQHHSLNKIYSESINTIRVCLLRRPFNNEIVVLNASLRMGKDGSLDNETAGGIVCNIDNNGFLNTYAINKLGQRFFKHPNSNVQFENIIIENYLALIQTSINIAEKLVFANLISLDMCLDNSGNWRCIEINLGGQTIRFSQYAGRPFLGEYTDEIIKYIKNIK